MHSVGFARQACSTSKNDLTDNLCRADMCLGPYVLCCQNAVSSVVLCLHHGDRGRDIMCDLGQEEGHIKGVCGGGGNMGVHRVKAGFQGEESDGGGPPED